MIKYIMQDLDNGRKTLGLVITAENVKRLMEGYPIHLFSEEIKMAQFDVSEIEIAYFPSEEIAYRVMKEAGFISDDTVIIAEKPIKN